LYHQKNRKNIQKTILQPLETTQKQAFQALNQAAEKAGMMGINANITILDTSSYLKSFLRMDNAFLG